MRWREALMHDVGPGLLAGISLGDWLKLLRDNRFAVTPSRIHRAMAIFFQSAQNSVFRKLENARFRSKVQDIKIHPPLFVLGHWCNGTTHLHNLLSVDQRFAFPNTYQVVFPHTFLSTETAGSRLYGFLLTKKRPMDNIEWTMQAPQEDEVELCNSTSMSPCLGWMFPERRDYYDRYLTFRGVTDSEIAVWEEAFRFFLKKLTWKYERPIILKSPPHTARIRLLLRMFPEAKFVHIHRNPYTVFHSSKKMFSININMNRLQASPSDLDEWIFRQYRQMYEAFFEDRNLIGKGNYHEVRFEDLERDPIGQMRKLYETLGLPDFAQTESTLRNYVNSIATYKKNKYSDLSPDLRNRIAKEWSRCFEEWNYAI